VILITTAIELVLLLTALITARMQVDNRFHYYEYGIMYLLFLLVNLAMLLLLEKYRSAEDIRDLPLLQVRKLQSDLLLYITFVMCWGSVIALMDQKLYGHLIAFMVAMIAGSALYYFDSRKMMIPFFASSLILAAGLPFFQNSGDVLVGHYVNLAVFVVIAWIASRIVYQNFCSDFKSKSLLRQLNARLEHEIEEKMRINQELSAANLQLKELTRRDELTRLPNRRSLHDFIDRAQTREDARDAFLSVMVIDIDLFKLYNDFYGHEEGDRTLIAVAQQIRCAVSSGKEFVCRWGGEEFIYLGYHNESVSAEEKAEQIRKGVSALNISHLSSNVSRNVTVSIGICTQKTTGSREDVFEGLRKADRAMYQAKSSGRNCIRNYSDCDPGEGYTGT
jgi:diguanylate cyclase (GGDEF)-like protein